MAHLFFSYLFNLEMLFLILHFILLFCCLCSSTVSLGQVGCGSTVRVNLVKVPKFSPHATLILQRLRIKISFGLICKVRKYGCWTFFLHNVHLSRSFSLPTLLISVSLPHFLISVSVLDSILFSLDVQ